MRRSTDRILTTHVGSLPRPPELAELLTAAEGGDTAATDSLGPRVREAVDAAVRRQIDTGLSIVNDGEQGKYSFQTYFRHRLEGFSIRSVPRVNPLAAEAEDYPGYFARWPYLRGTPTVPRPVCTGPVAYAGLDAVERELADLLAAADFGADVELFVTAVAPGTIVRITPNEHYSSGEAYGEAVAEAMKAEYDAIAAAGVILQVDCPDLGVYPRAIGLGVEEHRQQVAANLELLDQATRDIPPERMRFHVCWGADEAPHNRDVPLDTMLDLLLKARPAGMTIVGANGRHEWEWEVWRGVELPPGKVIIPGVIDSTTNIIEHPATVAGRIERYASVLGRENVIAGVDCGLATVAGIEQVDPEIAWAKLAALVEGARLATSRLWPTG